AHIEACYLRVLQHFCQQGSPWLWLPEDCAEPIGFVEDDRGTFVEDFERSCFPVFKPFFDGKFIGAQSRGKRLTNCSIFVCADFDQNVVFRADNSPAKQIQNFLRAVKGLVRPDIDRDLRSTIVLATKSFERLNGLLVEPNTILEFLPIQARGPLKNGSAILSDEAGWRDSRIDLDRFGH